MYVLFYKKEVYIKHTCSRTAVFIAWVFKVTGDIWIRKRSNVGFQHRCFPEVYRFLTETNKGSSVLVRPLSSFCPVEFLLSERYDLFHREKGKAVPLYIDVIFLQELVIAHFLRSYVPPLLYNRINSFKNLEKIMSFFRHTFLVK